MMDEKYGVVTPHLLVLDHGHVEIVEHEPVSIEPGSHYGVVFLPDVVLQDDDPKIISGNSRLLQSNDLCDRVIFAVPGVNGESG
jgi:BarA-like signal transduction histidine kinase